MIYTSVLSMRLTAVVIDTGGRWRTAVSALRLRLPAVFYCEVIDVNDKS